MYLPRRSTSTSTCVRRPKKSYAIMVRARNVSFILETMEEKIKSILMCIIYLLQMWCYMLQFIGKALQLRPGVGLLSARWKSASFQYIFGTIMLYLLNLLFKSTIYSEIYWMRTEICFHIFIYLGKHVLSFSTLPKIFYTWHLENQT